MGADLNFRKGKYMFCALFNIEKKASISNNETLVAMLPLNDMNQYLVSEGIGKAIAHKSDCNPFDVPVKKILRYVNQPYPYILFTSKLNQPSFSQFSALIECDLSHLVDDLVEYIGEQDVHTVQGFFDIFKPFDPFIAFTPEFLNEAYLIHIGKEKELGLGRGRNKNDLEILKKRIVKILRPFAILQLYAHSMMEAPERFTSIQLFDLISYSFIPPSTSPEAMFVAPGIQNAVDAYTLDPSNDKLRKQLFSHVFHSACDFGGDRFLFHSSYAEMLSSMMKIVILEQKRIKRCLNCGRLFVPVKRPNIEYCSLPSPQDPTLNCRSIGPIQQYQQRVVSDETLRLERQLYNLLLSRRKLHPENPKNQQNFEAFTTEKSNWKKKIKKDFSKQKDYEVWLKTENAKYRQK